jgi:hypothetical protein
MADVRGVTARRRPGVITVLALAAVLALVATSCSKGRTTTVVNSGPKLTTVFVQKFRFHGMPATLPAGLHQFYFQNKESFPIVHEMIPVALPAGKTAEDIQADAKANGPESEDNWLHIGGDYGAIDTGAGLIEDIYLPPGNYAIACWQTGKANGQPGEGPAHVELGMFAQFTVS